MFTRSPCAPVRLISKHEQMSILRLCACAFVCVRTRAHVCPPVCALPLVYLPAHITVILRAAAHGQTDPTRATNATHPPAMERTPAAR